MMNKKLPAFHVVKRKSISSTKRAALSALAFVLAILLGGIFIALIGQNPAEVYSTIISGAFRSKMATVATIKIAIPLLITALGVSLAFKMKFWNIGAEGQIIMGGIFASYFALFHADLPHFPLMLIMFAAGALGGGILGAIPAYFKCKYDTNETLFTLMLNYIALNIIVFLTQGPWKDPKSTGFQKIATFTENARLAEVGGVHVGWIIALVLCVVVFVYLNYTKNGYEISVIGDSKNTAKYAGMNVNKIVIRTMFLSGAVCGISGVIQVSGVAFTLAESVAGGVGFTAIIVAWLSRLNPFVCIVISMLLAILEKGSSVMQSTMGLSTEVANVLEGIILFVILAVDFFGDYKIAVRKEGGK